MRNIIGLTGYAGSGKDEAAKALIEHRGFVKVSFAEPLREAMSALNPIVGSDIVYGRMRYNDAIAAYGYDVSKQHFPEMRELLQRLGTEVGRKQFGESFWITQAAARIDATPSSRIVITDVRFPNEAELVRSTGCLVRVVRPGVAAVNGHVSDTGIDELPIDATIVNEGSISDLHKAAVDTIDRLLGQQPSLFAEGNQ